MNYIICPLCGNVIYYQDGKHYKCPICGAIYNEKFIRLYMLMNDPCAHPNEYTPRSYIEFYEDDPWP